MDNGKCIKCLTWSYGRLTTFGVFVVSLLASVIAAIVPLVMLQVGWGSVAALFHNCTTIQKLLVVVASPGVRQFQCSYVLFTL